MGQFSKVLLAIDKAHRVPQMDPGLQTRHKWEVNLPPQKGLKLLIQKWIHNVSSQKGLKLISPKGACHAKSGQLLP